MHRQSFDLKAWIREAATGLGFDLCGIASPVVPEQDRQRYLWWLQQRYFWWLQQGMHGKMRYMERPQRQDLRQLLPSIRSVICVAMVYHTGHPLSTDCLDPNRGWISRYAWGEDYHGVLQERLEKFLEELRTFVGRPFDAKIYVDTGPVLERALAQAAGLGWIGKNTCLIYPAIGSWFFLGEILTSLELEPDQPVTDHCGSCTRCIEACPTGAITQPYVLDARRCISYLTIELKGNIPGELRGDMGMHVFGCDICQDVCPWNGKALVSQLPAFQPRSVESVDSVPSVSSVLSGPQKSPASAFNPPLEWLARLTEEQFQKLFRGSPIRRARHRGLLRNVAVAIGNSRQPKYRSVLQRLAQLPDPIIQEHARWALSRLEQPEELARPSA
ncbi:MAG: tRNA epoxyqueuosine(34) reductase QueG [Acidobacteria bacterium]|nr:tRNA epoxyqueuosine(34) reductase QueG [Acidobacteriota bacterium]